jgi:hypothetical protein
MHTRFALALLTAAVALGILAASALALYPQLNAKLTGPAIGGVTPEGDAKVDQSKYPSVPPRLEVRVKKPELARRHDAIRGGRLRVPHLPRLPQGWHVHAEQPPRLLLGITPDAGRPADQHYGLDRRRDRARLEPWPHEPLRRS